MGKYIPSKEESRILKMKIPWMTPVLFMFTLSFTMSEVLDENVANPQPRPNPRAEDFECPRLMSLWSDAMSGKNYSAAASVYTNNGTLTGPHGTFVGTEEIKGFFAVLDAKATKYDYKCQGCNIDDDCTFKGTYDFGGKLGELFYEIVLDVGGKISKEIVTEKERRD